MKTYALHIAAAGLLTVALAFNLHAAEPKESAQNPVAGQQTFSSPEDAIKALRTAAENQDRTALRELFGPDYEKLHTGDKVEDENHLRHFSTAMSESCNPVKEGDDKITIEVGTNNWPMPIPLVKTGDLWHFDTAAGEEEIINRHIGKDELSAIGVCQAYVKAQKQFGSQNPNQDGGAMYALKFKSSPGMKDGLYWPASGSEPQSPFGPLVAEAHMEGYGGHHGGKHPFHGYYFKILTRQGKNAPGGKMDYLVNGRLTGGFALVAYPERWGESGIMTFIVNQDGQIYQKNLGEHTGHNAGSMKEYNPDDSWALVRDEGIPDAALEK